VTRAFSLMERAPWYVLYAFHIPFCLYLGLRYGGFALPTISNPGLDASGLTNESKTDLFALLGPTGLSHVPPFITLAAGLTDPVEIIRQIQEAGLSFPLVIKPDIGRRGFGVKIVTSEAEFFEHLGKFRRRVRLLVQRYAPGPGEAGLFYARMPDEEFGRILSLTLKRFPEVVGDGVSTLRDLILRDPRARAFAKLYFRRNKKNLEHILADGAHYRIVSVGNHVQGSVFEDASSSITAAMEEKFDRIAREAKGFFVGRFDVRYESLDLLMRGENFEIVEFNGASGEPTHMWDPGTDIASTYAGFFAHLRYLYAIGAQNKARGAKTISVWEIVRRHFAELWLLRSYPNEE
jgi:hypothetical protein